MKRNIYNKLQSWKASPERKPLILRGARQVGKTYLLKEFGRKEYTACIYLNFEEDPRLKGFFKVELKPTIILQYLSTYLDQPIQAKNTLLILDEIQECPEALNSLKYFYEEASEFHIIAAGSLLGVKLSHTKGFPVGKVNFMDLYPLTFDEFLQALGKKKLCDFLFQALKNHEFSPLPEPIHQELMNYFKKYMFIGGMPEAVGKYIATEDLLAIRGIQKDILDAYTLDFAKHAPKDQLMKVTQVWDSIPSQLAKENKKFIFSALQKSARGREYEDAIQWLVDAGLIYKSYNINVPKLPLSGFSNKNIFKVFLLDVGLLSAMSNIPAKIVALEQGLIGEFQGAFTENIIAQALVAQHYPLYYWTSEGVAKVDFIIEHELTVLPLEVKSGVSLKKKSLLVYADKFHPSILLRTSLLNLKKDGMIANIPLYYMWQATEICRGLIE
jgi:predicted AAA+ superfamily ATPase